MCTSSWLICAVKELFVILNLEWSLFNGLELYLAVSKVFCVNSQESGAV